MFDNINNTDNPTLLIVDDSEADRMLFHEMLSSSRYANKFSIREAGSCEEALSLLNDFQPICCLVDYQLPADNGLDFLKAIRRLEYGESIPVIIMTGEGDEKVAVEMMRNGAQDYLVKDDIKVDSLIHSINNAIHTCDLQKKLRHLAHYDNLTGLLNRSLFLDRLQAAVAQADRYGQHCSLLYIDVDDFKSINDQFGHDAGDVLLKAVGDRIKQNCRATDSASRLGGDEFAILLNHIDQHNTQITAEKILKNISEPITLDSQHIQVSLSIGVAHYPDTASTIQELMQQADEAMYRAKRTGKARYFQFSKEQKKQWERRNYLELLLPKAIQNGELRLAYQPIINVADERLHSLEVLVRWFPEDYTVSANEIIELVGRLGLFDQYHTWMIDAALKQLHLWQSDQLDTLLCLNIPADHSHSSVVTDCLRKAIANYHINPHQIELEITETTLMKHPELTTQLLQSLQKEGVKIAIDDFGTGYSSMVYLTTLPLNTLKIDRHFFADVDGDVRNRKVIEAVSALGKSLGLKVVGEGIETEAQYQVARAVGCDYVQGFLFGQPQLAVDSWKQFYTQSLIHLPEHRYVPKSTRTSISDSARDSKSRPP